MTCIEVYIYTRQQNWLRHWKPCMPMHLIASSDVYMYCSVLQIMSCFRHFSLLFFPSNHSSTDWWWFNIFKGQNEFLTHLSLERIHCILDRLTLKIICKLIKYKKTLYCFTAMAVVLSKCVFYLIQTVTPPEDILTHHRRKCTTAQIEYEN